MGFDISCGGHPLADAATRHGRGRDPRRDQSSPNAGARARRTAHAARARSRRDAQRPRRARGGDRPPAYRNQTRYLKLRLAAARLLASESVSNLVVTLDATRDTGRHGRRSRRSSPVTNRRSRYSAGGSAPPSRSGTCAGIFWFLGDRLRARRPLDLEHPDDGGARAGARTGTLRAIGASAAARPARARRSALAGAVRRAPRRRRGGAAHRAVTPSTCRCRRLGAVQQSTSGSPGSPGVCRRGPLMLAVLSLATRPPLVQVARLRIVEP